jgi:hypothetical protein
MKLIKEQIVPPNPKLDKRTWETRYNLAIMYDGFYSRLLTIKTYVL